MNSRKFHFFEFVGPERAASVGTLDETGRETKADELWF
jgi:hypothetical protein